MDDPRYREVDGACHPLTPLTPNSNNSGSPKIKTEVRNIKNIQRRTQGGGRLLSLTIERKRKKNLSKDVKKELIKGKRKKLCMFIIYSKRKLEFRKLILMNLLF